MSYDILAFNPGSVSDEDFASWWDEQSEWSEGHGYDDSAVTTPELRAFYRELIQTFPPMNGPDAPGGDDIDDDPDLQSRPTDYSIGSSLIYAAFAWSQASAAAPLFRELAMKHGVAVAMVSDDGEIVRPA